MAEERVSVEKTSEMMQLARILGKYVTPIVLDEIIARIQTMEAATIDHDKITSGVENMPPIVPGTTLMPKAPPEEYKRAYDEMKGLCKWVGQRIEYWQGRIKETSSPSDEDEYDSYIRAWRVLLKEAEFRKGVSMDLVLRFRGTPVIQPIQSEGFRGKGAGRKEMGVGTQMLKQWKEQQKRIEEERKKKALEKEITGETKAPKAKRQRKPKKEGIEVRKG